MKTKFTKGEWSTDSSGYFTRILCEGVLICEIKSTTSHNAHLIAAAPDMYAALEGLSKGEGLQPGTTIESILLKARGE